MNILIATVGGSIDPVVHAIRTNRPTTLAFLATHKGLGTTTGSDEEIPKILSEIAWSGPPPIVETTDRPDELGALWEACARIHRRLPPDAKVIANYTGGSKSMSAALVSFALRAGWELQLQSAKRTDLVRVTANDSARKVAVGPIIAHDVRRQAELLAQRYDHSGAAHLLEQLLADHDLRELGDEIQTQIARHRFDEALDAYDFEAATHILADRATSLSKSHGAEWTPKLRWFRQTLEWLSSTDKPRPTRITDSLALQDFLVETAKRAAHRGRYDDAFSRLYRATEFLAQVVLRFEFDVRTSDVDLAKLPPGGTAIELTVGRDGKRKAGLSHSYELLSTLGHPLGAYYTDTRSRLLHLLENRNESWLAHGFRSISHGLWRQYGEPWLTWLGDARAQVK